MPRVESDAEVTLVVLVYRSLGWLDFVMGSVDDSENETRYRWLVVANDATDEVRMDPRVSVDFRNADPDEWYIPRVYRAWNEGVLQAPTPWVILMNSDMFASDHWIDELMAVKRVDNKTVPTSLLVESGIIPSGMPEHATHTFGKDFKMFLPTQFLSRAERIRKRGQTEPGRLYMPILLDRQEFIDMGKYPEGNPPGSTGDKDLIRRYTAAGYRHLTALGSVVWHAQAGEQRFP